MTEYTITLGYTNDDDGIWIDCSCGKSSNIGWSPTIQQVLEAIYRHEHA